MITKLETLCIRLNKECNLECSHCRAGSSPTKDEFLDPSIVIELFKKLKLHGLKHISISGGEPFIIKDIGFICRQLLDLNYNITITTNGTIDLNQTDLLECVSETDKIRFRVSIDGSKKKHERIRGLNTFDRSLETISKLKKWQNWISVNTVVFTDTPESLNELCNQMDMSQIDEWAFISPVVKGNGSDIKLERNDYPDLLNECENVFVKNDVKLKIKKWDFLNTPNASVLIDVNGDILLTGVSNSDSILLGNISKESDLDSLNAKISIHKDLLKKSYFNWTEW